MAFETGTGPQQFSGTWEMNMSFRTGLNWIDRLPPWIAILLTAILAGRTVAQTVVMDLTGREVIVISDSAEVRVQGKVRERLERGAIVRVGVVRDNWLWIADSQGYLQSKFVIPVEEGLAHFDKIIATNPTPKAYLHRGGLHKHLGHHDDAIADYTEALRLKPDFGRALLSRALVHEYNNDLVAALNDFDAAEKIVLDRTFVQSARGDFFMRTLQFELADKEFSLVLEGLEKRLAEPGVSVEVGTGLTGRKATALSDRGWCRFMQEQLPQALADLDSAVELKPDYWFYRGRRRAVWRKLEKYDLLVAELDEVVSQPGVHPAILNEYAHFLGSCPADDRRDGKRAVELATKACEKTGNTNPQYLDTLAVALAEVGDFPQAMETQQRAISLADPSDQADFQSRLDLFRQSKPWRE